jgi:hypothetical protein
MQRFFGHFLGSEFFNSHAWFRQSGNLPRHTLDDSRDDDDQEDCGNNQNLNDAIHVQHYAAAPRFCQ